MYTQAQFTPTTSNLNSTIGFQTFNNSELTIEVFSELRKYIYNLCGIYFPDNKKYFLESRLQKRIRFLKLESFERYMDFLKYNANKNGEIKYLVEAITINETFFFRNQPQLDALVSGVIPSVAANKPKTNSKIKIWSAASSSGEEAYSTAIILNELVKPKYPYLDFEIIGTDINHAVIETANSGVYKEYSIRNTPVYYLKKYFKNTNGSYEIDPQIKKMVTFKYLNLYDDAAMRAFINFDVIFCANVLIYFDVASKIRVVSNLYNSLNRNGYLFIGYAETLQGISKAFKLVSYPKTIGYKKE
jgi:chemotaxis protein methyltransferase CheR